MDTALAILRVGERPQAGSRRAIADRLSGAATMPRADLHYALVLDRELWEASQVDPTLLDPVVRVEGSLPGPARPVAVVRDYQGPQGEYIEFFVVSDRHGRDLARSLPARIRLRGEMFTDRFASVVEGMEFETGDEHRATFYVDDEDAGTIPVFVESGMGGDPRVAAQETFSKAVAKGAVVWLGVPSDKGAAAQHRPVWYVADGGKLYVFDGPTEQQVPGLPMADRVEITARSKDTRSRVSRVPATVRVVPPDDPLFDRIGQAGMGRRLNLPDGERALERWRANCALVELTPEFTEPGPEAGAA